MEKFIEVLTDLFHKIFNNPITDLTFIELVVSVALTVLFVLLVFKLANVIFKGLKFLYNFIKANLTAKEKCKHIQCTGCGRTLDKCVCQKNRGKSNFMRLVNYRKERRMKK